MSKGGGGSIPSDYTIKLGSDGSTIHVDSDLDNIHLKEIVPITVNSNLAVTQPIVTQSTAKSDANANLDVKIEPLDVKIEPLKISSDSTSAIDVKPLAIDSCQTLKLAPLPPVRMEQPYSQHLGITFLGIELWGFSISGKTELFLHSPPKQQHFSVEVTKPSGCGAPDQEPKPASTRRPGGLRVRVK
jgi:hypothetical protein